MKQASRHGSSVILLVAAAFATACGGGGNGTSKADIVNLTGKIVAPGAAQALVTVTVGERSFQGQADANGNYNVQVQIEAPLNSALVTLSAKLVGGSAFVELLSRLGSYGEVQSAAGADGTLTAAESVRLNLSNLSTAEAVLAEEAGQGNGKAFTFGAGVDPEAALKLAGALELATTDPANFALPQDKPTTLTLARDPQTRVFFIKEIEANAPEALEQATLRLVQNTDVVGVQSVNAVPPELLAGILGGLSFRGNATADTCFACSGFVEGFEFASDGGGLYFGNSAGGNSAISWAVEGSRIEVELLQPSGFSSFELVDCDGSGATQQQEAQFRDTGFTVVRLSPTAISLTSRSTVTYPACPNLPPREIVSTTGRTILSDANTQELSASQFDTAGYALGVPRLDAQANDLFRGTVIVPDVLNFGANGSGAGRFVINGFSWTVQGGALILSQGETVGRYRKVRSTDGLAELWLADYRTPLGRFADLTNAYRRDPSFMLTSADFPARFFFYGIGPEFEDEFEGARLLFDANGRGAFESDRVDANGQVQISQSAFRIVWSPPSNGEFVFERFRNDNAPGTDCDPGTEGCRLVFDYIWVPINRNGQRYYIFERRNSYPIFGSSSALESVFHSNTFYDRVPLPTSGKSAIPMRAEAPSRDLLRSRAGYRSGDDVRLTH
jgi:hypothetical protein